jgi:hypothetical protein
MPKKMLFETKIFVLLYLKIFTWQMLQGKERSSQSRLLQNKKQIIICARVKRYRYRNLRKRRQIFEYRRFCRVSLDSIWLKSMLWVRIHRIHLFVGLPEQDLSLFVQIRIRILLSKSKKVLKILISTISYSILTFSLKTDVNVPLKSNEQKNFSKNVTDSQHWLI